MPSSELVVAPFQSNATAPSLRLPARISYYEVLSRMLSPERKSRDLTVNRTVLEPAGAQVIVRDFAYNRMAAARNNVDHADAKTFAEYV